MIRALPQAFVLGACLVPLSAMAQSSALAGVNASIAAVANDGGALAWRRDPWPVFADVMRRCLETIWLGADFDVDGLATVEADEFKTDVPNTELKARAGGRSVRVTVRTDAGYGPEGSIVTHSCWVRADRQPRRRANAVAKGYANWVADASQENGPYRPVPYPWDIRDGDTGLTMRGRMVNSLGCPVYVKFSTIHFSTDSDLSWYATSTTSDRCLGSDAAGRPTGGQEG